MDLVEWIEQIDDLLFTGVLQGEELLTLHNALNAYRQGLLPAEALQSVINRVDGGPL